MFTGIVEKMGKVQAIRSVAGGDRQLMIAMDADWISRLEPGQSISINGTCLTVTECDQGAFGADVSMETLRVTTLGELKQDDAVNLELPLTLQAPLGGHLVSGHVDGVGIVRAIQDQARSKVIQIEAPMGLMRYIAPKGSICIDGVSLTVNRVDQAIFGSQHHSLYHANHDHWAICPRTESQSGGGSAGTVYRKPDAGRESKSMMLSCKMC